jgi:hypothetical protein
MKERKEKRRPVSRRSMLKGSAMFFAGGIAGGLGMACSTQPSFAKTSTAPPPLPWEWVTLDPMEAGRRAFNYYLTDRG